ncbi:MAG: CARDB domain-containing protein [Caldilineaceae bacterium]
MALRSRRASSASTIARAGFLPDNSLPVAAKKTTAHLSQIQRLPEQQHEQCAGASAHLCQWRRIHCQCLRRKATTSINQGNSDSADIYFNVNFSNDVNVTFYAEVDPNNTIAETNESNNRYPTTGTISMTFRKRTTLDIVGQRLRYHPSGYSGTQYAGGWAVNGGGADFMEQMLPIRNNGIDYSLKSGYLNWTSSLGSGDGQHALIQYLNSQWIMQNALSWLFGTGAFTGAEHVYGWAPNDGYSGGHADMPVYPHAGGLGVVGIGTDRPGTSTDNPGGGALIMAHELIHDYDVKHTNTADSCGSSDSSSTFPYGSSSIQEFGFNPITGKIYDPTTTHDVMSYCPAGGSKQGWVSPFTWNYMSSRLDAVASAASLDRMGVRLGTQNMHASAADKSLVVNAAIYNPAAPDYDPNHPGDLYNLHQIDAGLEYPLPGEGYAVELRKGAEILYTEAFSVSFQSEYHDGHSGNGDEPPFPPEDTLQADVSLIMPWIDGTTDVVLLKGEQVLATQKVSANAPTVSITSPSEAATWPAGSTQMVTWTGDDADGDSLTYTILYSFNSGESWDLLETGLISTSYEVPVDAFAGSDSAVFRVVATDGVNMGYAESAPVSIPNKAPEAIITNPVNGSTEFAGNLVVLQGSALDLEDGRLDDSVLNWSSDKQGALGTGPSVAVNNLQLGTHVITLTATDSNGNTGSAAVTISIESQVVSAQTAGEYLFIPIVMK